MGKICSIYGGNKNGTIILFQRSQKKTAMGDQGILGKIILKPRLKSWVQRCGLDQDRSDYGPVVYCSDPLVSVMTKNVLISLIAVNFSNKIMHNDIRQLSLS